MGHCQARDIILYIMQRKRSRKIEIFHRVIIYSLMTATVALLLVVLILTVVGYRFNFRTNSVEQTGLVQYNSYPSGAIVKVDGRRFETTQTKGLVLPGQRQFSMTLDGYESWQKTLQIEPGTVTWLSYVRLVPTEKQIESIDVLPAISNAVTSPDRRFMAGVANNLSGQPEITLIDFRDSKQPKISNHLIDTTDMSGYAEADVEVVHDMKVVRWSASSRYMLLKHQYTLPGQPPQIEWLWVDRESPEAPVNITSLLGLPLSDVYFADGKDMYVLQENGDIRRASVDDGSISRPLISQVTWFEVYDNNTISYLGTEGENRVAGVWRNGWSSPTTLMSVPSESDHQMHISVSKYFNKDTVAISDGTSVHVYRGSLPSSKEAKDIFIQSPRNFTLSRPVNNLQFSEGGRFVVAEDSQGVVSYDIERITVSQEFEKFHDQPVRWLDGYHLWQIDDSGQLVMQEFDGLNYQDLMPASSGYDVSLTKDGRYLYGLLATEDDALELRQLSMVAKRR